MMNRRILPLIAMFLGFFVICIPTLIRADATPPDTLLPRDPNNVYGQFDNGVKYIIRKNANPPGKVALYLHVRTGALNETDEQNGLAHFIEHMAFKGSAHFAPSKLLPLLTHLGMTFGADTNAHTNLWETVFKLTMPDTKPKTIDTALTILSDYASALDLAPIQIESERRVILEESRTRKSVGQRLDKQMRQQLFAGTRLALHDIIGDEEQIKTFVPAAFVNYWNTWYRPENMTLIVVGDIDPQTIIAAAKEKLGSFTSRAPAQTPLKAGLKPLEAPKVIVLTDPEQVTGEVELITMQPGRPPATTYSQYRREVLEDVCSWIVNRRFTDLIEKGNAPFRRADIGVGDFLHEALECSASATGQPQDWNKMLDATIAEVSRAIDHGFTQHELDLARSEMLANAQWDVKTESSEDSTAIVSNLAEEVGVSDPILSAQQRLDLMTEILGSIHPDELHDVFTQNFKSKNYAYILKMPASDEGIPTSEDVLAAATAAWSVKTAPPEEIVAVGTLLPAEPVPGKIAQQETDKDLGITTATFENGVVLHHKFTDYKKDQIIVQITLPGGILEETAQNRGISSAANMMFARPATSRFTSKQIRDFLTGKNVSVSGGIGTDTLSIGVEGSTQDLSSGMQLAYALLTDAKLEQPALDQWKKNQLDALRQRATLAEPHVSDAMAQTVYGGDIRFLPLTAEMIGKQERQSAEDWLKRIAGNAAIEVAVVGDIQLQDAVDLIAKYVGSLPKRSQSFDALNDLRTVNRQAGPYAETVHFNGITPKAMVIAGFLSCDSLDPARRPLSLASRILSDRMINEIRIHQQLVYSIQCQNSPGEAIPGAGMISAGAPTDPKNADKLGQTILDMLKTFAKDGPTEDELASAKKQTANQLASQMKEPSFWIVQIGQMKYRGRPLSDLKQLPDIYQTFTVDQVRDVMRKYVTDDHMICLEAIPDVQSTTMPTTSPVDVHQ